MRPIPPAAISPQISYLLDDGTGSAPSGVGADGAAELDVPSPDSSFSAGVKPRDCEIRYATDGLSVAVTEAP